MRIRRTFGRAPLITTSSEAKNGNDVVISSELLNGMALEIIYVGDSYIWRKQTRPLNAWSSFHPFFADFVKQVCVTCVIGVIRVISVYKGYFRVIWTHESA